MSRIAVIDLGTNTFNLLVADMKGNSSFKEVFKTKIPVKLGEGGINRKTIRPEPFERGIAAIQSHLQTAAGLKVEQIYAFATSAIRSAANGKEFTDKVKEKTGLKIKVISGDEEAQLIYQGVKRAVEFDEHNDLIIDIGGGSTEFIICNKDKIHWKQSYDIGGARLLEKFKPSDPVTKVEIIKLETYFEDHLEGLLIAIQKFPVKRLTGASGSFDTFFELIAHRFYSPDIIPGNIQYNFQLPEYYQIHERIISSSKLARLEFPGMVDFRVDTIVLATVLVNFILKKIRLNSMRMSAYALKEGVLVNILEN